MSPDFLKQMQMIVETVLLDATKALLPVLLLLAIAYVRKLAQKLHTDAAVAATEQNSVVEARATGVTVTGPEKYMTVVETLLEAGVRPDPTLIEAAVHGLKNPAP